MSSIRITRKALVAAGTVLVLTGAAACSSSSDSGGSGSKGVPPGRRSG
ncbi:hypothetical protein ACQ86D_03205 [Streptomyces galilaeus]